MIPMTVSLQASRSLVSAHSSVSVQFVMALMSSSYRARGLPLFLAPPPIPNIIDFSKLFSLRMMCPKYDSCCFFICASSGLVGLISSITDLLVLLAVHGILRSLLQHHNSKLSILLLSAFLIVQDSQPYSTTVEPLSNDHPHQRPSLLYDHISLDEQRKIMLYESLTSDHPSYTTTPM